MKRRKATDRGQSLVEFALVLPIFALMLMAIIDFGLIFTRWLTVEHAARDAVRYASLGYSASYVTNVAEQESGSNNVTVTAPNNTNPSNSSPWTSQTPVTVTIQTNVQIFDPIMAAILGNPYTLSSSVTMLEE